MRTNHITSNLSACAVRIAERVYDMTVFFLFRMGIQFPGGSQVERTYHFNVQCRLGYIIFAMPRTHRSTHSASHTLGVCVCIYIISLFMCISCVHYSNPFSLTFTCVTTWWARTYFVRAIQYLWVNTLMHIHSCTKEESIWRAHSFPIEHAFDHTLSSIAWAA